MRNYTKRMANLRDRARRIAEALRPEAARIDADDLFPPALLERLWEEGFMTLRAPRSLGGGGAGLVETAVAVEELARGCGAAGLLVLLQALGMTAIFEAADEKKGAALIGRLAERREMCAFALSEPEPAGGEKTRVTTARKQKAEYVLEGKKTFVSGGRDADLAVVFAVTSPKAGLRKALSAFVVPAGTTGMLPGRELPKSGLRGVPASELVFTGCRLPSSARLGRPGEGYGAARGAIVSCLPLLSALATGLLREALDLMLGLARERAESPTLFSEFQAVDLTLAEMAAGLDQARGLGFSAASALEEGAAEGERLAREAKWLSTEAAVNGIDLAARLLGVEGSLRGGKLERLGRDARTCQIMLGPNHLHRLEAARRLLAGR